ncbi:MAG: BamA/TamA family outer membrane protein [Bacteroidales bacterium]|nr:BamA/TamA family outer membrane protein [Bacteroidales bacterium]
MNRQRPSSFHKSTLLLLCATLTAMLFGACHGVKDFVKDDERVLNRNQFVIEMPDGSKPPKEIKDALSNMRKYTLQQPNSHVLGFGPRLKMNLYCLSSPTDSNWVNRYLRRQGQAPVIYAEDDAVQTAIQINNLLSSKGCFRSEVTFDTVHKGKYDVNVTYRIHPAQRYMIDDVTFHAETPEVNKLLKQWQDESLIHKDDYYDQDVLDNERTRLVERLRNEGYFLASPDLVSFLVDSAFENHILTIDVNIRNPRIIDSNNNYVSRPLQVYRLDDIFIYPNSSASNSGLTASFDTIVEAYDFRNRTTYYKYLFNQPMTIRPTVIDRSLFLFHGQTFRPHNIDRTYSSLLSLRNFKYINIELSESPNSCDTARLLNAKVRLLTAKKQRLSASIEINNSSPFGEKSEGFTSGNFGLETKLSYLNKNLFGGAELFKAEFSLLVELPKLIFRNNEDNTLRDKVSSFENGIDLSLDLPTFLFPFTSNILWQRMRPHTIISLGGNYQYRSYFERLLFNTGFGYNWHRRQHTHLLLPIEMTYVRFFNIDSAFQARMQSISDARVKYQYSDHFIMDARYDYIYNTQQYNTRNNFNYIHLSIESAGNLLNVISHIVDGPKDENGIRQLLGVPFSQYIRFNAEYKRYFYIGEKSTFVARCMAGIGLPYSNSSVMPYEKSFYGGGPTTMRAWHLRQLGPGNFLNDNDNVLERVGDMQLVINLEYRFPIFSIFEGAVFTDIGNVWLVNSSQEFPGGQLSFKNFPQSIATGIGLGLRANISILTLRCDLAIPLYDPGYESNLRWRPPHWRFSQITANFGIDYPF